MNSRISIPIRSGKAFTLIELLTVIAIIGILAGIMIPVVGRVRASALKSQGTSNLRQLQLALTLYAQDSKNKLPPAMESGPYYWTKYVASYLGSDALGVGQNNVFRNPQTGANAIADEGVRRIGYDSPFSCPAAVRKYASPALVSPTFAINAYLYLNRTAYPNAYDEWAITWTLEPSLGVADRPSRTVLFTHAKISNSGSWYSAAGVVRETEFSTTELVMDAGVFVGWLDGHVSIEKKDTMFASDRRPGGASDIWSLFR